MPLKTDSIEEPNLNLTPMIDIVFLLIIFFMVGTQFSERERELDVQVPSVAQAQPLIALPDEIVINIRRSGEIVLDANVKSIDELEQSLVTARSRFKKQAVMIRGDAQVPYQHVASVLSACHRAKIESVSLATQLMRSQ
ncbi:MAG: biopolymer transporter ExbD [Planctomycetaceae bacterium]